ncbi:aldehyde dehydrogenase family protein [Vreelandella titanicae]|uniref:aldehyde dehydrogenase family protein n=1 Tax=Vreelandella titanicae TaxID=664683 RepID=UPI00034B2FC0|nr:aldehyde dehydrogenase family protein [Halomonas titanicae]
MPFDMLIKGRLEKGAKLMDVIDPSTREVFAQCARASAEQVNLAVDAAAAAFDEWSSTPLAQRQAVLARVADVIEANTEELARLLTKEQGKPLAEATTEVGGAAYLFRHYSSVDIPIRVIEETESGRVELHRRPLGVVGAILPWNFPVFMASGKIAPALLAGNTMVLKPAPSTPLTTLRLGELLKDIIPAGTLNIITDCNDLGPLLTSHPKVRKIAFTGSTQTGLKVMSSVAADLKRLTLELGGNDAGIVLDDCDPKQVAPLLFKAAFANNGQVCVAMKRLYVPEKLYDAVCEELAGIANKAVVGPGLEEGVELGPIQNREQYEKLKALIEESRWDGEIIAGGDCPQRPGYFINPTIVRDIAEGSRLVDEEQFGPVLPVIKYADLNDAVYRANATSYGLGNSVWSPNVSRAHEVACRLDSGTVWVNQHGVVTPTTPFAGAKLSGFGVEFAEEGLAELTQVKVVNVTKI